MKTGPVGTPTGTVERTSKALEVQKGSNNRKKYRRALSSAGLERLPYKPARGPPTFAFLP